MDDEGAEASNSEGPAIERIDAVSELLANALTLVSYSPDGRSIVGAVLKID